MRSAGDGQAALEELRLSPDAVVLDLMLVRVAPSAGGALPSSLEVDVLRRTAKVDGTAGRILTGS